LKPEDFGWKVAERWVKEGTIWLEPIFIHDFGDSAHHMSMVRTCEFDEYGAPIRGTGPSNARYLVHEFLDNWIFYPIQEWMSKWIGDNEIYNFLRDVLGFFWGINCGFPLRDIALYFVWVRRGCHRENITVKRYMELFG